MNALSSLGSVARLLRQRLERREGKQRVRADNTVVVPTSRLRLVDLGRVSWIFDGGWDRPLLWLVVMI